MINPVFAAAMLVGLAIPMLPTKTESAERRLYWAGALIAILSAFLTLYPPDWRGGLIFSGAIGAILVFRAYMGTSHIRIRGRIYAFNLSDSHADDDGREDPNYDPAPDSYGGLATALKTWWLFVFVICGCVFIVAVYLKEGEGPWYALGSAAVIVIVALLAGNQDASWGYGAARGQWLPFVLIGIVTVGAFTALYFLAFAAGRWRPLRPKRSMEYRAHPHLRKKYD